MSYGLKFIMGNSQILILILDTIIKLKKNIYVTNLTLAFFNTLWNIKEK